MSGTVAGIISIFTLLVGAAIVTTLVRNPQGTSGLISSTFGGFSQALSAAQGNYNGGVGNITMPGLG